MELVGVVDLGGSCLSLYLRDRQLSLNDAADANPCDYCRYGMFGEACDRRAGIDGVQCESIVGKVARVSPLELASGFEQVTRRGMAACRPRPASAVVGLTDLVLHDASGIPDVSRRHSCAAGKYPVDIARAWTVPSHEADRSSEDPRLFSESGMASRAGGHGYSATTRQRPRPTCAPLK